MTVEAVAPRRWHAEYAWLARGDGLARDVLIEAHGARFTAVTPGTPAAQVPARTVRLRGLTLSGLANAHSHAFHRALRGRPADGGTFWTRREGLSECRRSEGGSSKAPLPRSACGSPCSTPATWPAGSRQAARLCRFP